ncbi:hypothetical protein ILUMI_06528 [Ignelater luminosus]|uniref:Uncharacterized protein n=1 Tax=Ignelater luminosus TaxID=2038154 RepID=A0A8K0DA31_IGNLU|nr:hypothetical protein ILUMI_06528 [Ignelater luminosus]
MVFCLPGFILVIILLLILKIFQKFSTAWDHSQTCLVGKTAIVTGANTGIGYHTALDFAKRGARVILACRNKEKAEKAKHKIIEQTGNSNVTIGVVDFASLASVRAFVRQIKETEDRLDILVNNAGALSIPNCTTDDGLNLLMQTNYFGPTLLTLLLIDLLKKSTPSRIVNVSSIGGHLPKLDSNDLNAWPRMGIDLFSRGVNYGNSKLCTTLFTNELARRLSGSGVTVNSLHPGFVKTEITRGIPYILKVISDVFLDLFFKSPEEGAQTSIYVAVSKDIEGVTGEYFENCKIAWLPPMSQLARDEKLARKVWDKTEKYINLTAEEKRLL